MILSLTTIAIPSDKPGFEVHPADGEGGGVDAGGEVVQVVKDASGYWLSAVQISNFTPKI